MNSSTVDSTGSADVDRQNQNTTNTKTHTETATTSVAPSTPTTTIPTPTKQPVGATPQTYHLALRPPSAPRPPPPFFLQSCVTYLNRVSFEPRLGIYYTIRHMHIKAIPALIQYNEHAHAEWRPRFAEPTLDLDYTIDAVATAQAAIQRADATREKAKKLTALLKMKQAPGKQGNAAK